MLTFSVEWDLGNEYIGNAKFFRWMNYQDFINCQCCSRQDGNCHLLENGNLGGFFGIAITKFVFMLF